MDDQNAITVTGTAQQQFVPQLADRLSKALANAGRLELDGNNQFHHYQYPTVAQVRGHANKAMSAAGLGIIPEITQEGRTTRETDKGKVSNVTFVKMAIHVFAPEGMFTVRWVGESEDMTDKGLAKAVSAGVKSFLVAMMLMPVGEEENDDGEYDAKKSAPVKRPTPKPTKQEGPELKDDYSATQNGNGKLEWPAQVITWAVQKWNLKPQQVVGALNKSAAIKPSDPDTVLQEWLSDYRTARETQDSDQSAHFADNERSESIVASKAQA